jgi:hypothetical protein
VPGRCAPRIDVESRRQQTPRSVFDHEAASTPYAETGAASRRSPCDQQEGFAVGRTGDAYPAVGGGDGAASSPEGERPSPVRESVSQRHRRSSTGTATSNRRRTSETGRDGDDCAVVCHAHALRVWGPMGDSAAVGGSPGSGGPPDEALLVGGDRS